jgi:hypothetical protein
MNPLDKILVGIGALIVAFIAGLGLMHEHEATSIEKIKANYNTAYNLAVNAKNAADKRATDTEKGQKAAIDAAVAAHDEERKHEKAHDDAVIADLRNDVTRLRVRTNRPASGGEVPGAPAGAGGPVDAGDETLAGPVAARLAGRYADYNRIVDKLTECQVVIQADRLPPLSN